MSSDEIEIVTPKTGLLTGSNIALAICAIVALIGGAGFAMSCWAGG